MGQYHRIFNLTQRTVLEPFDAGDLDKLREFCLNPGSVMAAVWLLLASEAWCGDRIAILGYEFRQGDLAAEVVAETGLDVDSYYDHTLENVGDLARRVLSDRGVCRFTSEQREGYVRWVRHLVEAVPPAGVEVVAVNRDRGELLDPAQFGDSRDLHLSARSGFGGVITALTLVLAASNRGGSRGGGDFRGCHAVIGSWAGDHIAVVPIWSAQGLVDVSPAVRAALAEQGDSTYEVSASTVVRRLPAWASP